MRLPPIDDYLLNDHSQRHEVSNKREASCLDRECAIGVVPIELAERFFAVSINGARSVS
jgi:hypothetical protein